MPRWTSSVPIALLAALADASCPDPVAGLLGRKLFWMLEVQPDCEVGDVEFDATTSWGPYKGTWDGYCVNKSNTTLTIMTSYHGVNRPCETQADCQDIQCETQCAGSPSVCAPVNYCYNTTQVDIGPEEFEAACPPDDRDVKCKAWFGDWESLGCTIFNELADDYTAAVPMSSSDTVNACLYLIEGYNGCLRQVFWAAPAYRDARLVSQASINAIESSQFVTTEFATTEPPDSSSGPDFSSTSEPGDLDGTGETSPPQCISIPHETARYFKAIPCSATPLQ
mmetsp:Transcript_107436/g.310524  ORF Transcript_107436/g.310524 Transcript_107436/m.310524 type:complete len:281 (-) Transcript_107436:33-875(-)